MDATTERPRLAVVKPDGIEQAKAEAIRAARQAASEQSIRESLKAMLSMPLLQTSRIRDAKGQTRAIGLALSSDLMLEHLLRFRGSRGQVTGYDVFAAMLLDSASAGASKVQAMRLVVDLIEPIMRTIDLPSGGVSFVFGDSSTRDASESV